MTKSQARTFIRHTWLLGLLLAYILYLQSSLWTALQLRDQHTFAIQEWQRQWERRQLDALAALHGQHGPERRKFTRPLRFPWQR